MSIENSIRFVIIDCNNEATICEEDSALDAVVKYALHYGICMKQELFEKLVRGLDTFDDVVEITNVSLRVARKKILHVLACDKVLYGKYKK